MRKITSWLEKYTEDESLDILRELARTAAMQAGSMGPFIEHFVHTMDFKGMLETELVSYDSTGTADNICQYRYARQALGFFQKLEFLDIGVNKRKAATTAYIGYEQYCKETNDLYRLRSQGACTFGSRDEWIHSRIQRLVRGVLGEVPQLDTLKLRFGPGATTSIAKREASIVRKLGTMPDCSGDLLGILPRLLEEMPSFDSYHRPEKFGADGKRLKIPAGVRNFRFKGDIGARTESRVAIKVPRLSFVPKNAKTYRTTEAQPLLNGMLQLAIGDEMARRLRRAGLDISDQLRNQEAAREGSLTGDLATLDLKGASDTVAFWTVLEMLPAEWVDLLVTCRCGKIEDPVLRNRHIDLEKFSAMGNGFTFPLESLIFWTLTRACLDYHRECDKLVVKNDRIEVYGDDIICPTEIVPTVMSALHTFGFILNKEKSYWAGPFRESCGADFLSGTDIRPIYAKEQLSPAELFTMHNGLKANGMEELAEQCLSYIHPSLRLYGPPGYGDGYLHSKAWPRVRQSRHLARGFEGSTFKSFIRVPKRDIRVERDGEELMAQYSIYSRSEEDLLPKAVMLKLGSFDTLRRLKRSNPEFMGLNLLDRFTVTSPSEPIPLIKVWVAETDPSLLEVGPARRRERVKAPTFPGTEGYKVVSNYILANDEL